MAIILVVFYFLFPLFIIYLTQKSIFLKKVGAVVMAYAFGMILGNVGLLPRASDEFREIRKSNAAIPN